ncbi:hypothetical protein [Nonomuraea ferruginea]|uniref:DUF998 domain-containing protein n=1 Tax=Nonomuraea ferruginea TaxID=46174 RepID=A0ABT4T1N7_9ACTN|nr:hypothetical protein [Nonomuraea ferruginea]MDA0643404.1 hypothetical protein [Nonomuraea ferruginea]
MTHPFLPNPARARDSRVWDLLCVGIAVGVVSWGAVGAWTAVTVGNYPWNKWIPFAYGATKGVLLGLLAAAGALAVLRTGRRLPVFVLAFVGGGLLGTVRDLLGPPAPMLYFSDPLPAERWYWTTTMLLHWAGKVALPAVVCAAALTLLAARPYRPRQSTAAGAALLLAGFALLLLPTIASSLAPEIQGNGEHTNQEVWAFLRCWALGMPVLAAGAVRFSSHLAGRGRAGRLDRGGG